MTGEIERMLAENAALRSAQEYVRSEEQAHRAEERARWEAEQAVLGRRRINEFVRLLRERSVPSSAAYYTELHNPLFGGMRWRARALGVRGWLVMPSWSNQSESDPQGGMGRAVLDDGRLVVACGARRNSAATGSYRTAAKLVDREGQYILELTREIESLQDWEAPSAETFATAIEQCMTVGSGVWPKDWY